MQKPNQPEQYKAPSTLPRVGPIPLADRRRYLDEDAELAEKPVTFTDWASI